MTEQRPHGLWDSLLSPETMAGDLTLRDVAWSDETQTLVWQENRGGEGRLVARRSNAAERDVTREHDVQGGVGYGGGALAVHGDTVFFVADEGRLHRSALDEGRATPIVPPHGRTASPTVSPDGARVVFVHTDGDTDLLASVDAEGTDWPTKLITGADFYMQPEWHPAGDRLAWIEWDHPNMPWDGTRLKSAEIHRTASGLVADESELWDGDERTSILQPAFSPDGSRLAYISDRTGWWHLYLRDLETGESRQLTDGDFEIGGPAWVQGMRWFAWGPEGSRLYALRNSHGKFDLLRVKLDGDAETVDAVDEYDHLAQPTISTSGRLAFLGSANDTPPRVVTWGPGEADRIERRSSAERVPDSKLADVEPVSWTVETDSGQTEVYGNYYPPTNPEFESSGPPPALLMVHGGPTSQRTAAFEAENQFFASRGYAVLDVNYRGSTGYGREFRTALQGEWGVADVDDVRGGADFLVDEGLADPDRLVVMGGSAGGYTVFQMLVSHPGAFAAGIAMYGVSNLFTLATDTHKFEEHYTDSLIGPLPDASETYRERSPIYHADSIEDPLCIFQGGEDEVVPRQQSDSIVESLESRGIPHEYHVFEDEGHGWRNPETVEAFYEKTQAFLKKYVLFG
ncbi:MAG: prolyl oligopeptidase family serine peptidase [Bradymonadaceae bacterium]